LNPTAMEAWFPQLWRGLDATAVEASALSNLPDCSRGQGYGGSRSSSCSGADTLPLNI
jgi:hypothetical protein